VEFPWWLETSRRNLLPSSAHEKNPSRFIRGYQRLEGTSVFQFQGGNHLHPDDGVRRFIQSITNSTSTTRCRNSEDHNLFFFFNLVCEAIGTAATPGILCQPRVIVKMFVEKQMECRLKGETEVLRENLPQRHLCQSQNPT
jgi:hypothetical protein